MVICIRCGREIDDSEVWYFGPDQLCLLCYQLRLGEAAHAEEGEAKHCTRCGRKLPVWGGAEFKGNLYCDSCYSSVESEFKATHSCRACGKLIEDWEKKSGRDGSVLCASCLAATGPSACSICGKPLEDWEKKYGRDGSILCQKCFGETAHRLAPGEIEGIPCSQCGGNLIVGHAYVMAGHQVCESCYNRLAGYGRCRICGKVLGVLKVILPDGSSICPECAKKHTVRA